MGNPLFSLVWRMEWREIKRVGTTPTLSHLIKQIDFLTEEKKSLRHPFTVGAMTKKHYERNIFKSFILITMVNLRSSQALP